jgi:hypothetical protein
MTLFEPECPKVFEIRYGGVNAPVLMGMYTILISAVFILKRENMSF